jgi:hypothetical protein
MPVFVDWAFGWRSWSNGVRDCSQPTVLILAFAKN